MSVRSEKSGTAMGVSEFEDLNTHQSSTLGLYLQDTDMLMREAKGKAPLSMQVSQLTPLYTVTDLSQQWDAALC